MYKSICAIVGLTVIGVTAMLTGIDGVVLASVVGGICAIGGYVIAKDV